MWLYNVCNSRVLVHLILQKVQLLRQYESFWQKIKMAKTMSDLHFRNALIHEIFTGDMKRVRKVIDFLIWK